VDYYNASGERTSAFVGWNTSPAASFANHAVLLQHINYMNHFQGIWGTGPGLRQSLDDANEFSDSEDIDEDDLTVFGYRDLGCLQGNNN
jgi:hypothetical protein